MSWHLQPPVFARNFFKIAHKQTGWKPCRNLEKKSGNSFSEISDADDLKDSRDSRCGFVRHLVTNSHFLWTAAFGRRPKAPTLASLGAP